MNRTSAVDDSAEAVRWQLSGPGRKVLLTIHLLLACIWFGSSIAIVLLQSMKDSADAASRLTGIDRAIFLIFDRLIVNSSYGFIVTGLAFSLFTSWGAWRYRWVALKWIGLLLLGVSLPVFVAPHVSSMTALSDAFGDRVASMASYAEHGNAVFASTGLQALLLAGLVAVSVVKPWGKRTQRIRIPRWVEWTTGALILAGLGVNLWLQEVNLAGYRNTKIGAVDVNRVVDGTYDGSHVQDGFEYRVSVVVKGGRISGVDVVSNRKGAYAESAALVAQRLAGAPRNDVDAISGATTTSTALLLAVEQALRRSPTTPESK